MPAPVARMLRWTGGYAGLSLLTLGGGYWTLASYLLVLVSIVLVFTTKHGRGLPGILSGQHLEDSR